MRFLDTQGQRGSVRHRGAAFVVLSGAILLALAATAPAAAAASASASASQTITRTAPMDTTPPSPEPPADVVPTAPVTVTSPANDTLFPSASVTISGTKDAAGRVEVQSITGGAPYCVVPAGTTWSCSFTAPTGRYTVTVFQYFDNQLAQEQATITVRVLPPPTITGTPPIVTTGFISGTGFPGSGIQLSGSAVGECPGIVQPSGFWSCPLDVSTSGDYPITARQTWGDDDTQPGGSTGTVIIRVDKDPPAVPAFTQPGAGTQSASQPTLFSGTGESGGRVDVFVDDTLVCSSGVSAGLWSCVASLGGGEHRVQGIQRDAAGNPSGASTPFPFSIRQATVPAPPPAGGFTPGPPSTAPVPPAPIPVPAPSPSHNTADAPRAAAPAFPFFPAPIGGISGRAPLDTWGTPTYYGAAIPTVDSARGGWAWLWGLALGIGFVLLVALPLRLALTALRGRFPRHYFARDHSRLTASEVPQLRPRLTLAGAVGAATVLAALASGIQGEVRYLRLAFAIAFALLILNGVSVAITTRFMSRALGGESRLRLVPLFLTIAAITALISRGGGIQPPVIVGVVVAASFVSGLGARSRDLVAVTQLVVTMVLGAGAWIAHSAMGPVDGFLASFASETLSGLCIAAIGSAVILSLPVSRMPGRLIFEWSPVAWVAVALAAATLSGVIIAGGVSFPVPWVIGLSLAFAALCLLVWAWIRLIEPAFPRHEKTAVHRSPALTHGRQA